MALIGSDSERGAPKAPISRHRAFPAVVALWFAALLGFGSLILPAVLLERGVSMTGIAAFVPAASPPLGLTARALIALAAAGVGALVGIAIARRVRRAQENEAALRAITFANGARRPIDVAELGGEGLAGGFGQPVTRRRALAIAEHDQSDDAADAAPLPGADEYLPLSFGEHPFAREPIDTPFEPCEPFEDPAEAWSGAEPADSHASIEVPRDLEPLAPEPQAEPGQGFDPAPAAHEAAPLPFAAPAVGRRGTQEPDEPLQATPTPAEDAPELVQLAQRLKSSLERRREGLGVEPQPLQAEAERFEPAPEAENAHATQAYFGKTRGVALPAMSAADEGDEVADEDEEADGAYSSLLAMRGPYTPGTTTRVHIEIDETELYRQEAVEPDEPGDTDAALRAALAKLQRMGGSV